MIGCVWGLAQRRGWRVGLIVAAVMAATSAGAVPSPAAAAESPIGAHSMLQLNDPPSFMQAMFAQAVAMGASSIRLDVAPAFIFSSPSQPPDFSGLDEVMSLATQYHLHVVADLLTIPYWLADCPQPESTSDSERCGTSDLTDYASVVSQIVAHADPVIQDWEVWNEPDSAEFFRGTPAQYAWMLRTAHDAIKQADPADQVLLGGLSGVSGINWLAQVFSISGPDAAQAFDIANLHERNRLDQLAPDVDTVKQFLASQGFTGPLWITEHGYPSDPAFQYDPGYAGGPAAQAAFLTASLPTLLDAGASEVFVTERDNLGGQFASEGVLGGDVADPPVADPQVIQKPAFGAVATLSGCYLTLGRDCPGTAPAPAPAALALQTSRPHSSSEATVTVSDPGAEPIDIGQAALSAATLAPISVTQDSCSHTILEPDERCTVTVRFAPASGGDVSATLQIPSDQGALSVPVTAAAPADASLEASPTSPAAVSPLNGADGVGASQWLALTLTNPLRVPVRIASARLSGAGAQRFSLVADTCSDVSLGPGSSCGLDVVWRPNRPGTGRAVVTVAGVGAALTIPVQGAASPLPVVRTLAASNACLSGSRPDTVRATVSQAATVRWTLERVPHPLDRRCVTGGPAGHTSTPGARWTASGHTRTAPRSGQNVVTFAISPRPGGRPWRPGPYRLTIIATNVHGVGTARALWLTIAR